MHAYGRLCARATCTRLRTALVVHHVLLIFSPRFWCIGYSRFVLLLYSFNIECGPLFCVLILSEYLPFLYCFFFFHSPLYVSYMHFSPFHYNHLTNHVFHYITFISFVLLPLNLFYPCPEFSIICLGCIC